MAKRKKAAKAESPEKRNTSKIRETFSQAFNEQLAKAGLSIEELAIASGISKSQLYDYRRCRKSPTVDALDALAGPLKCEAEDFLKASPEGARSLPLKIAAPYPSQAKRSSAKKDKQSAASSKTPANKKAKTSTPGQPNAEGSSSSETESATANANASDVSPQQPAA